MNRTIVSFVVAAVALGGCLVVPASTTTVRNAGTETAIRRGPDGTVVIGAEQVGSSIDVRVTDHRECERQTLSITETTTRRRARLASTDPRSVAWAIWIAPITIPVSALISGIVVAGSHERTTRKVTVTGSEKFACVTAAAVPVVVVLPSGRVLQRETDATGRLAIEIPDTEPYRGTVELAAGSTTRTVSYSTPIPPVTALRDAARGCAAKLGNTGSIELEVAIDGAGRAKQIATELSESGDLSSCVLAALDGVEFPADQRDAWLVLRLAGD